MTDDQRNTLTLERIGEPYIDRVARRIGAYCDLAYRDAIRRVAIEGLP